MSAIAFEHPAEVREAVEGLEAFLRREVMPRHERHARLLDDERRRYSPAGIMSDDLRGLVDEVRLASAEAGFYAMCAPAELGGGGLGLLAYFAAHERLYRLCGTHYWLAHHVISHWAKGPSPVLRSLSPAGRARYLPRIMSGEDTMCFGLSEPGAGSDATMLQTRAVADGDGWRLSGGKIWTTNAPHAQFCVVFALTDPAQAAATRGGGISTFLVPMTAPGVRIDRVISMWGHAGGDEAEVRFDEVRVEPDQLMGELHKGFATAMLGVDLGRIYNCARSVGLGRWGLEKAFDYVKVRKAFGKPIADYQGVTFPLAESAMQIHAAHLMSLNVAQLKDRGLRASKELAMAKAFAAEAGARALDRVIQAHGAMGMTNELGLTEAYVTLRKIGVADGTNEILRRQVVKEMLGGNVDL
jgi:acyl-CoA dehydrogenase